MSDYDYYDNENEIKDIRADYCKDIYDNGVGLKIMRNRDITPEMAFISELWNFKNFLEDYISDYEFENIKNFLQYYNHHLNKNPFLIILSYIVIKLTTEKESLGKSIETIYKKKIILDLIKENSINPPDILRYCRYIKINIPNFYNYAILQRQNNIVN